MLRLVLGTAQVVHPLGHGRALLGAGTNWGAKDSLSPQFTVVKQRISFLEYCPEPFSFYGGHAMLSGISSGLSALKAIQTRTQSTANNTANVNTDAFKKTRVTMLEDAPQGVTTNVQRMETPGAMVYETTQNGEVLVEKSNVDLTAEMPQMMIDRRAFQANIKTLQAQDEMLGSLLDIKG
jgi:flagellar basal-body rod protein FlgC